MSGGSGQGRLLSIKSDATRRTGRSLLTRKQHNFTKVLLDGVVVSEVKQALPIFYAVEITSLNRRFTQTPFKRPTIGLVLRIGVDYLVELSLWDKCKTVSQLYKKRKRSVELGELFGMLTSITGRAILCKLTTFALTMDVPVLRMLTKLKKFSPASIDMIRINCHQKYFRATVEHYAGFLKSASFHFDNGNSDNPEMDWQLLPACVRPLTALKRLYLRAFNPPPESDWLQNVILVNSQLKLLELDDAFLDSPVVLDAFSAIAQMNVIRIYAINLSRFLRHLDWDLCGLGQCTLTKLVLNMKKQTGCFKVSPFRHVLMGLEEVFYGDILRLACYLLSLSKTGKSVVVKTDIVPVDRMEEFLEDLHFYHPRMSVKWHSAGDVWIVKRSPYYLWKIRCHYLVRVGSVKMFLCEYVHT